MSSVTFCDLHFLALLSGLDESCPSSDLYPRHRPWPAKHRLGASSSRELAIAHEGLIGVVTDPARRSPRDRRNLRQPPPARKPARPATESAREGFLARLTDADAPPNPALLLGELEEASRMQQRAGYRRSFPNEARDVRNVSSARGAKARALFRPSRRRLSGTRTFDAGESRTARSCRKPRWRRRGNGARAHAERSGLPAKDRRR